MPSSTQPGGSPESREQDPRLQALAGQVRELREAGVPVEDINAAVQAGLDAFNAVPSLRLESLPEVLLALLEQDGRLSTDAEERAAMDSMGSPSFGFAPYDPLAQLTKEQNQGRLVLDPFGHLARVEDGHFKVVFLQALCAKFQLALSNGGTRAITNDDLLAALKNSGSNVVSSSDSRPPHSGMGLDTLLSIIATQMEKDAATQKPAAVSATTATDVAAVLAALKSGN